MSIQSEQEVPTDSCSHLRQRYVLGHGHTEYFDKLVTSKNRTIDQGSREGKICHVQSSAKNPPAFPLAEAKNSSEFSTT